MREDITDAFIRFLAKGQSGERENRITRISFYRHGEVQDDNRLSPMGFEDAVKLGLEAIKRPPDYINASTVERTIATADGFRKGAYPSGFHPGRIGLVPLLAPPTFGREELSPEGLASWTTGLAYLIDCYSEKTASLEPNGYLWVLNFTHSMAIDTFMELMTKRKAGCIQMIRGDIRKFFGSVEPLRGFDFLTVVDKRGSKLHRILFGNTILEPDMDQIEVFVNRYKEVPYRGISDIDKTMVDT